MIGTEKDMARKLSEATRGLIALNGAALGGIIGLIESAETIPLLMRISGGIFLIGIFSAIMSWAFGDPFGHNNDDRMMSAMKTTTIFICIAFFCFFVGISLAFVSVNISS